MRRILFTSGPAEKELDDYRHPRMRAMISAQIVIQEGKAHWGECEMRYGFVLQCTPLELLEQPEPGDEPASMELFEVDWTIPCWFNPILWWRAMQFYEAMPVLRDRIYPLHILLAGRQSEPDCDYEHKVREDLCAALAEGSDYQEILSRPVPMEVLRLLIDLVDGGQLDSSDVHMAVCEITDEIEAGTVRWSQELKRIGVRHPDYRRAMEVAHARMVRLYEVYLCSYADARECPYNARDYKGSAFIMRDIESCIYQLIECGIEHEYGMPITIMLAIIWAEMSNDEIQDELEKKYHRDRRGRAPYVRPEPESRYEEAVNWYLQNFVGCVDDAYEHQRQEYSETLHRLYALGLESLLVTHPLVD